MGNQKSSIEKLCADSGADKATKTKKSHSLNMLLQTNFFLRSNSNRKLRLKFYKKSKQKSKSLKSVKCPSIVEYTSLNECNTKNLKSNSFQDNYFSIYDDFTHDNNNNKNTRSKTFETKYDNNLYSKIVSNSNPKHGFLFAYHLQPFSRLIHKLGAFSRKTSKYPSKRFDPNEEFYLNLPVQQKLSVNTFHDQSNLYTDMSESICSDMSKIRIDTEENYQSLYDQYDYISTSSRHLNISLEPPPLPPQSTQPCRELVINQIFTCIEPLSINNQVYYSFSSDKSEQRFDILNDGSILLSSSSICTSARSSLSNENLINTNGHNFDSDQRILQI